jgi:O-antigen ligase
MHLRTPALIVFALALAAAAAPSLLVYNVAPSPTFLNQALACALWGGFVAVCTPRLPGRGAGALWLALALLGAAVLWSWGARGLPPSLALSALALLVACALLVAAGVSASQGDDRETMFALFCWAWVAAGLLNLALAGVQVFAPELADGHWIGIPNTRGRAMGNLRQPNHLSSLLMWASVAVVGLLLLRRMALGWAAALLAGMVFGVVLTASRTGALSVGLLALWGLLDRRLPRHARALLLAAPLMYAVSWWGLSRWATLTQAAFGGEQRLAEADISGSRFGIWANAWTLVTQQPLTGVGFGNFNLAWTLTPFPGRPVAFFDHSHNLALQLAAELGLPLAGLVLALLLWALVQGWRRTVRHDDHGWSAAQRVALMMVLMIGLHSMLEYPLWYAYFLLPAGWAFGYALALDDAPRSALVSPRPRGPQRASWAMVAGAALLMLGALAAVAEYRTVTLIYRAYGAERPLEKRIEAGQRSLLFAHHADYAAVTSSLREGPVEPAFDRASRFLLDTRLMMAWAEALAAQGDIDLARYLAGRLREFRKPESAEFFAACPLGAAPVSASASPSAPASAGGAASAPTPAVAAAPAPHSAPADPRAQTRAFACEQPTTAIDWTHFLKTAR